MAIEIKELTVRINIQEGIKNNLPTEAQKISKQLRNQIVQECIEKVMDIIERQKGR